MPNKPADAEFRHPAQLGSKDLDCCLQHKLKPQLES
jgi:hypothetical protein